MILSYAVLSLNPSFGFSGLFFLVTLDLHTHCRVSHGRYPGLSVHLFFFATGYWHDGDDGDGDD